MSQQSRTPSPSRRDARRSSPDVVPEASEGQIVQDLGFFAQEGRSPAAAVPINPATHFFRQRRHSEVSTNSDAAFIDHRAQPHSMSTSMRHHRASTTAGRTQGRFVPFSPTDREQSRSDMGPSSARSDVAPVSPRLIDHDERDDAVIDHRERPPSIRSPASQLSHERPTPVDDDHMDLPPVFTPSVSRRPSDAERALEDVCFPHLELRGEELTGPDRAGPPMTHGVRGLPGLLHNFPYPFDFSALEELAAAEREVTSPSVRPHEPLISFSPSKYDADKSSKINGFGGGEMGSKPYRRMRKLSESAGTGRGSRYQRKLALFEGFGSDAPSAAAAASATPETTRRADAKTPLLGRTRSGRGVYSDIGTQIGLQRPRGPRRTNSTMGGAESERERPYRFSFYSNGLPSTIHARSLGEIPAEGQTYEELFVGKRKEQEASDSGFNGFEGLESTTPSTAINGTTLPPKSAKSGTFSRVPTMVRSDEDTEDNTWWLDVLCPTDAEMRAFSKCFGIHPLTTEDIQMEETREKIELFRNYYLVCFRSFDQDPYSPTYLEPLNMYVIVFREGTLSFHYRATPHPQNVRRRIKQLKDYISVSSDWISYALIDDITDAFGPLIQNIEYEVDSIDELVLILKDTEQSDMLRRIGTCRKKVMGLLRLMGNKADVVKGLAKRCNEHWSVAPKSDIGLYLSDIQDHLLTMTANLNHYEKILSRSHSNYLAQISIEMTEANNQINDVLSRLTALGTVLVPLNLVTGLWGMNVQVPGQEVQNLDWFFSIVAALVAFAVIGGFVTYRVLRR